MSKMEETPILSALQKRQQLIDIAKITEADRLASARSIFKQGITAVTNNPKTIIPYTFRNGLITDSIWAVGEDYIRGWLKDNGYSLEVKWHDSGNGDFVDEVVIDYL